MQSTLDHYLQLSHQGSDTVLKFDFTGAANFTSSTYAIVLSNAANLSLDMQTWLNDGRVLV